MYSKPSVTSILCITSSCLNCEEMGGAAHPSSSRALVPNPRPTFRARSYIKGDPPPPTNQTSRSVLFHTQSGFVRLCVPRARRWSAAKCEWHRALPALRSIVAPTRAPAAPAVTASRTRSLQHTVHHVLRLLVWRSTLSSRRRRESTVPLICGSLLAGFNPPPTTRPLTARPLVPKRPQFPKYTPPSGAPSVTTYPSADA